MGVFDKIKAVAEAVTGGQITHDEGVSAIVKDHSGGLTEYGADDMLTRQIATGNIDNETHPGATPERKKWGRK